MAKFFLALLFALERRLRCFKSTFYISIAKRRSGLGRLLTVKVTKDEERFFVTNVYAPTDYRDQDSFIPRISKQIIWNIDTSKVVISGDWN